MGYSHKLNKTRITEWKDYYINYDMLRTHFNDEKRFITELNKEAAKVNGFFIAAEKTVLDAKDAILKKKAASDCREETEKTKFNFVSDNCNLQSSSSGSSFTTDLGEPLRSRIEDDEKYAAAIKNEFKRKVHGAQKKKLAGKKTSEEENLEKEEIIDKKLDEEVKNKTEIDKERIEKSRSIKKQETIIEIDDTHLGEEITNQEKKKNKSRVTNIFNRTKNIFANNVFTKKGKNLFKNNILRMKYNYAINERDHLDYLAAIKHVIAFRNINLCGFRTILNRYDTLKKRNLMIILMPQIERCHFNTSRIVDGIFEEVSKKYASIYHRDNPEKARRILKNINRREKSDQKYTFLAGLVLAACGFTHYLITTKLTDPKKLKFYYSVGAINLGLVLFSVCLIIFKTVKINYNFIFGFVHGSHFENNVFLMWSSILVLFHQLTTFFLYEFTGFYLILFYAVIIFMPFDIFYRSSRFYLLSALLKISCPLPFFQVKFKHFIVADVLLSFSGAFKSLLMLNGLDYHYQYSLVYLPYTRLVQCIRRYFDEGIYVHLLNGLKYVISMGNEAIKIYTGNITVSSNLINYSSYLLYSITSFYSLFWDFFFDWTIIRKKYIFPIFLYVVISFYDTAIRFIWVYKQRIKPLEDNHIILLEVLRRYLWLLLRIEQEHLNNCNNLQAVKFIDFKGQDLFYRKGYEPLETEGKTESESNAIDTVVDDFN